MLPGFPSLSSFLDLRQLGDYAKIAVRGAGHRTELASIELEEAKDHAAVSLLIVWAAAVLALLFGAAATLVVAAIVWDGPHRVSVLAGLAGLYLLGALVLALFARRRLTAWKPFSATADQLRKDARCLENLINTPEA